MSSLLPGAKLAVTINRDSDSTFRSSNTDYMARRENNSTISSHKHIFRNMDSGSAHKVRLVRCPICRTLLLEPADISVYKCGGCGRVLRVKNRKNAAKSSGIRETEAAQMNELDHVSEVGEWSSSSQKPILPSSGECSLDQNDGRDQKISTDCGTENSGDVNSSDEEQNKSDHNEPQVCGMKQLGVSHEFCSSNEDANHEIEDVNSSDADQNKSDHNEPQVCGIKQPGVSREFCSSNGDINHENEESLQFSRASSELELNDMSSLLAGAKLAVTINRDSDSTFRSSNTDYMARRENNSTISSHKHIFRNMDSGSAHKVRLVIFPICRTLLPEPADISVYKCGGCGTVLQVKNRKNAAKSSGLRETEAAQMNELDHISEVGEWSSSSQKPILPSSGEFWSSNNSTMSSLGQAAESISSDILVSSLDEQSQQLQMSVHFSYERRDLLVKWLKLLL